MTAKAAAALTGCTIANVHQAIRTGKLSAYKRQRAGVPEAEYVITKPALARWRASIRPKLQPLCNNGPDCHLCKPKKEKEA